jgi:hypothetical protein
MLVPFRNRAILCGPQMLPGTVRCCPSSCFPVNEKSHGSKKPEIQILSGESHRTHPKWCPDRRIKTERRGKLQICPVGDRANKCLSQWAELTWTVCSLCHNLSKVTLCVFMYECLGKEPVCVKWCALPMCLLLESHCLGDLLTAHNMPGHNDPFLTINTKARSTPKLREPGSKWSPTNAGERVPWETVTNFLSHSLRGGSKEATRRLSPGHRAHRREL